MPMDKRQRAMLREMGVRVWQPLPLPAHSISPVSPVSPAGSESASSPVKTPEITIYSGAPSARIHSVLTSFNTQKAAPETKVTSALPDELTGQASWRVGAAQTLYADTALEKASRWLVLLEAPASALASDFDPLDGDAGKLLDNMLRAARLHLAGAVLLAPLVRSGTGGHLPAALTELFASAQADVVLVMGRLAAQSLLQSSEPLNTLRGQIHELHGQRIVTTLDPTYLLRHPLDKAKVWDDLCLALSLPSGLVDAYPRGSAP